MKLLINLCGHDGIISHYNGVGTMCIKYIKTFTKVLNDLNIDYDLNLFTPLYNETSFGYNKIIEEKHLNLKNIKIYKIDNNSNGEINYGKLENWRELCKNTAKVINEIKCEKYDQILTIYNDTPFACLANHLNKKDNHKTVLILHSTIKIHEIDSAIEDSEKFYDDRLKWENDAIEFINNNDNAYMGVVGEYIKNHLIKEYNLNKKKVIKIYNGELFDKEEIKYSPENKKLFTKISNLDNIILSFGRAEPYKNLHSTFLIGKELKIKPVVIGQLYYKEQPIAKEYKKIAKETNGILYIDPPFDYAKYILNNYNKNIICLIPSKKEIQGLIINEIRKLNKDNVLIVANNINGLKEQIKDKYDGLLIDTNDIERSTKKIKKYFNKNKMKKLNKNAQKTLYKKYNFYKNIRNFIKEMIGV